MILVCVAMLLLAVAVWINIYNIMRLQKKSDNRFGSLGLQVSNNRGMAETNHAKIEKNKELIDFLCEKIDMLELNLDRLSEIVKEQAETKLDEVLEKKWEDAIRRISDFDPFSGDEK